MSKFEKKSCTQIRNITGYIIYNNKVIIEKKIHLFFKNFEHVLEHIIEHVHEHLIERVREHFIEHVRKQTSRTFKCSGSVRLPYRVVRARFVYKSNRTRTSFNRTEHRISHERLGSITTNCTRGLDLLQVRLNKYLYNLSAALGV